MAAASEKNAASAVAENNENTTFSDLVHHYL
jgi:hypothetical protein